MKLNKKNDATSSHSTIYILHRARVRSVINGWHALEILLVNPRTYFYLLDLKTHGLRTYLNFAKTLDLTTYKS